MLATNIKLAKKYNYLSEKFVKAYEWLENNDPTKMDSGRYDICEGVFAIVQRYTTSPFDEMPFEAHNDYFDIQYLAQGKESLGICLREGLEIEKEQTDLDVVLFKTPKFYTQVNLQAGDFVCIPPEEAHQPRVQYQKQEDEVVKVVIKVSVK